MSVSTDTNTQESTQRLHRDLTRIVRSQPPHKCASEFWCNCMKIGRNEITKGYTMKQGDTVFLNSGSPELTIESITGEFVKCIWFDGGVAESGTFNSACLTLKK